MSNQIEVSVVKGNKRLSMTLQTALYNRRNGWVIEDPIYDENGRLKPQIQTPEITTKPLQIEEPQEPEQDLHILEGIETQTEQTDEVFETITDFVFNTSSEPETEIKPKRTRRTKEQIEQDKNNK